MKEKFTKFQCDFCKDEIVVEDGAGYPYEKGWHYIFNFEAKLSNDPTSKIQEAFSQLSLKDKHLCSTQCFISMLQLNFKKDLNEQSYKVQVTEPPSFNFDSIKKPESISPKEEEHIERRRFLRR